MLKKVFLNLRSSYWFLPAIMMVQAFVFAFLTLYLDLYNGQLEYVDLSWLYMTGAEGARSILSTIAGSMITVTGVVFSVTIVSLSLASQQFGPRLLQNFMRDRGNQLVLGVVTATFLYCLLVLRTVSRTEEQYFVPHISVLFAMLLAVLCVAALIYFIHHVAEAIQVNNVIASVSDQLASVGEQVFPERFSETLGDGGGREMIAAQLPESFAVEAKPLPADRSGYLQAIDFAGLAALAAEQDAIIRNLHRVGHFIVPDSDLVEVYPGFKVDDESFVAKVNRCFLAGSKRTQDQDMEFLIDELVEIAGRALSPGVNDPYTAITCIDHLGKNLCRLARRAAPSLLFSDANGDLRLIAYPITFDSLVAAAFNQIRQYGRDNAAVTIRLLEIICEILPFTHNQQQRDALLAQAGMIERGSHVGLPEENDRQDVHQRYLQIFQLVEERYGLSGGS